MEKLEIYKNQKEVIEEFLHLSLTSSKYGSLDWLNFNLFQYNKPLFKIKVANDDKLKQCKY